MKRDESPAPAAVPALDPRIWHAAQVSLFTAAVIGVLGGFVGDFGAVFRLCLCTVGAYACLLSVIAVRRGKSPSKVDLLALKWGFLVRFTLGIPISAFIASWKE